MRIEEVLAQYGNGGYSLNQGFRHGRSHSRPDATAPATAGVMDCVEFSRVHPDGCGAPHDWLISFLRRMPDDLMSERMRSVFPPTAAPDELLVLKLILELF